MPFGLDPEVESGEPVSIHTQNTGRPVKQGWLEARGLGKDKSRPRLRIQRKHGRVRLARRSGAGQIQTALRWARIATEFVTEPTFRVGSSSALFELSDGYRVQGTGGGDNQDVFPDDQRFLLARRIGSEDSPTKLIWVQNFFEELKARVPN